MQMAGKSWEDAPGWKQVTSQLCLGGRVCQINIPAKQMVLGVGNSGLGWEFHPTHVARNENHSPVLINRQLSWEEQEGLGKLQVSFEFNHSFLMSLSKGLRDMD